MLPPDRIRAICSAYSGRGWFVDQEPGADRIRNVLSTWRHPPQSGEEIVVLLDTTVFGSGKAGLAVCEQGVHCEPGIMGMPPAAYAWQEFGAVALRPRRDTDVQVGTGCVSLVAGQMAREDVLACLLALQKAAVEAGAPRQQAYAPPGRPSFPAPGEPPPVLLELLAEAAPAVHVHPDIPPKKLRNARESMKVPADETVLALFDDALLRSAKVGMVVGTRGIYWNNSVTSGGEERPYRDWDELARTRVARCGREIMLGEKDWVYVTQGDPDRLLDVLLRAQWWARARLAPEARRIAMEAADEVEPGTVAMPLISAADDTARWHLARDGQQFGPYSAAAIGVMIGAGQVVPDACYAWAEGMAGWVPMLEVPELAGLLTAPAPAAPSPNAALLRKPSRTAPLADAGTVDVNTADVDDLLVLPGMTLPLATLLVHERRTRGGFKDVEQVGQALRLQPHQVERMRALVTFGRMPAASARVVDF